MTIITIHRIAVCQGYLFKVNLVIHCVWMVLTNIILPTACTTSRTSHTITNAILLIHYTNIAETLVSNDIITKDIQILLYHWT